MDHAYGPDEHKSVDYGFQLVIVCLIVDGDAGGYTFEGLVVCDAVFGCAFNVLIYCLLANDVEWYSVSALY